MAQLIVEIGIGPPASGKSTALRARQSTGGIHYLSPDTRLYDENNKYVFTKERSAKAWATEYQELGFILVSPGLHDSIVQWDAMMTSVLSRSAVLNICIGAKAIVHAIYVETPLELCLERNRQRTPDRRIPDDLITRHHVRFEPPTLEEGFAQIIRVKGY